MDRRHGPAGPRHGVVAVREAALRDVLRRRREQHRPRRAPADDRGRRREARNLLRRRAPRCAGRDSRPRHRSGAGQGCRRPMISGGAQAEPLTWRDIRGTTRRYADELIATEAEAASLTALRAATGETDGGMERHTARQYLIAERIADARGIPYDRELLLCASFLHDPGLYGAASTGDVSFTASARYARRTLEPFGWPDERLRVCLDACEQHHAFTTRWWMATEVELVRRSDLVEVYPELRRFGIPRSWLKRELWHAVPRTGFWPATLDITRTHWRRMLPGMFRPPGPGSQ